MKPTYRFQLFTSLLFLSIAIFGFTSKTDSSFLSSIFTSKEFALGQQFSVLSPIGSLAPVSTDVQSQPRELPITAAIDLTSQTFLPLISTTGIVAPSVAPPNQLHDFIELVANGQNQILRGVYVEGVLALPVVQQPQENSGYVDTTLGTVTQFQSAAKYGVTGLLAHNYLSGDLFFSLERDQEVNLVYGDARIGRYIIVDIQSFQKLAGDVSNSYYVNLDTGEKLSTTELFNLMYTGGDKVTFQTCIKKDNDWSWGRIFINATPLD
jgi:hypothetical protein